MTPEVMRESLRMVDQLEKIEGCIRDLVLCDIEGMTFGALGIQWTFQGIVRETGLDRQATASVIKGAILSRLKDVATILRTDLEARGVQLPQANR